MTTATFDALAYFEKLKAAGVPEEQAKVQANAYPGAMPSIPGDPRKQVAILA